MCGLTGFTMTRPIEPKPSVLNMFAALFIMSQLRGVDSSGISINWRRWSKNYKKNANQSGWLTYKDITSPYSAYSTVASELFSRHANDKKKNNFDEPYISTAICHARAATKGTVTKGNAHPFSFGNNRFVGVHNGTISNARAVYNKLLEEAEPIENTTEAPTNYGDVKNDVTDSEIILYCIYRFGIDAVYPLIEGAWAFVFYRQDTGNLYFIRNYQRPLHIMWSSTDDVLFWSSEAKMIEFCAKRYAYTTEWTNNKHAELDINKLYEVELRKDLKLTYSQTTFPWTSVRELKPKAYQSSYTTHGSQHNQYSDGWFGWGDDGWEEDVKKHEEKEKKSTSVIVASPPTTSVPATEKATYKYSHIQGKVITLAEWLKERKESNKEKISSAVAEHKEDEESVDSSREDSICCWCAGALDSGNKKKALKIKGTGTVCGVCATDIHDVESICDSYAEAAADSEWVKRYVDLSEQEQKKGSKRA